MLAMRVDLEMNYATIGTADFLLLEIDSECRVGPALGIELYAQHHIGEMGEDGED